MDLAPTLERALDTSRQPIPLARLARMIGIDEGTITDEIEPWLCAQRRVFIEKRGRSTVPPPRTGRR